MTWNCLLVLVLSIMVATAITIYIIQTPNLMFTLKEDRTRSLLDTYVKIAKETVKIAKKNARRENAKTKDN